MVETAGNTATCREVVAHRNWSREERRGWRWVVLKSRRPVECALETREDTQCDTSLRTAGLEQLCVCVCVCVCVCACVFETALLLLMQVSTYLYSRDKYRSPLSTFLHQLHLRTVFHNFPHCPQCPHTHLPSLHHTPNTHLPNLNSRWAAE